MTELNGNLYIGGRFETLYGDTMYSVARYNDATGIFEPVIFSANILIYPSPAKDNLTITLYEGFIQNKLIQVNIYEVTGKLLIRQFEKPTLTNQTSYSIYININTLKSGIYIVEVKNANGFDLRRKIVKE